MRWIESFWGAVIVVTFRDCKGVKKSVVEYGERGIKMRVLGSEGEPKY